MDVELTVEEEDPAPCQTKARERGRLLAEKIVRVMDAKVYAHWKKEVIGGIVAEDGSTPQGDVEDEVRRTSGSSENLKPSFWTNWRKKFGLDLNKNPEIVSVAADSEDEQIDEDILEAVAILHSPNPALRRVVALEKALGMAGELNRKTMVFIIKASATGANEKVTSEQHEQIVWALLKYFGRIYGQHKIPWHA